MSKGGIIKFRDQQNIKTIADDKNVKVFAPAWVEKALVKLSLELKGAQFEVGQSSGKYLVIKDKISLTDLVAIARNEIANTSGVINFAQYNGINKETIIALRDLVKHCVIVGKDIATHHGGYPFGSQIHKLNKEVYICDLPGLQFQQLDNTGRHVLILQQDDIPKGTLDKEIFKQTVGEEKSTFTEANQDKVGRFLKGKFKDKPVLFDTKAFQAFVMQDFILAATALNSQANVANPKDELNFKFLKYGAGFFAEGLDGEAKDKLSENLALGVLKGIEQLFNLSPDLHSQIKRIELPYYKDQKNEKVDQILNDIKNLCERNKIEFASTMEDALSQTSQKYKTATTNCSDPHAPTGNEMNYGSVDAAIAENLKSKGNNFSPICNSKMGQQYVVIDHLALQKSSSIINKEEDSKPLTQHSSILTKIYSYLSNIKWSAMITVIASSLVKTGQAGRLGFASNWMATLSTAGLIFVGLEIMRFARNIFTARQYLEYQHKTDKDFDMLNQSQLTAFDIGRNSAKSIKNQIFGLCLWQSYRSPKAYYAGYEAQIKQDNKLIAKINSRLE
jgi:hypothetical protein